MSRERIEQAVKIINYAIKNQISVKEASVKHGYADTYIKNIKAIVYEKYENGILDDELFSLFDNAYNEYLDGSLFPKKTESSKPQDLPSAPENKTTFNMKNENEAEIEWVGEEKHIKTLDELLTACDVDLNTWKVKDYTVNKWDVTSWKSGQPERRQNFQVKARLERIQELVDTINVAEIFADMIKNYTPPILNITKPNLFSEIPVDADENNLLEISIFDLHMGKLAWGGETGENYDTKIARARFLEAIEILLKRAAPFNFSRVLFPVGNDFFNSDTILNTTTKGTPQDEDLRWQKTFMVGVTLLVDAINMLKQTGVPVDVVVIPGNHDFERSYYMGAYLEAWFNNDNQVTIDNHASPRKYYRFGDVLIGLTHGSEEKESSLPMLMATDIMSKPHWSETKYHEWHLGHQHRKKFVNYKVYDNKSITVNEDLGVVVRYLSSLTGTEEWHHKKGYIGQIKAADGFIWNDESGMIAHLNANISINSEL